MSLGTSPKAVQPAGTAIQRVAGLYDAVVIGKRREPKCRHRGAKDGRHGRIHRRGNMHRGGIIDVIHDRALHQCGRFEKRKLTGQIFHVATVCRSQQISACRGVVGTAQKKYLTIAGKRLNEFEPLVRRILLGEPYGRWGDAGVGAFFAQGPYFLVIGLGRVEAWLFKRRIGPVLYQGQVARYFVDGLRGRSEPVRHPVGKQPGKRVLVKTHRLPGAGQGSQQPRSPKPLAIDHQIVLLGADLVHHLQQSLVFRPFFIPNQHFSEERVMNQQFFIAFAQQEINLCARVKPLQFFYKRRRQHDIADESGLDDQYFQSINICANYLVFKQMQRKKEASRKKEDFFSAKNNLGVA